MTIVKQIAARRRRMGRAIAARALKWGQVPVRAGSGEWTAAAAAAAVMRP
ncbi:hypothetical protein NX868_29505 [Burkholderia thailandensis]|uniref:Uncharacterized protein n=1 Tax=Burkholderia thailandensis TaxID=57975 RepID=A0AAW9CJ52_BURTH|nr:hypothetical protein [Burkholderia thailandensis]MCS3395377.1 hypothetical protein [Burkholderia thailandensis]MCS6428861.1 hypothetical protein [Burkholderia thailandensis]MCS6455218.1 hypothetical protein [Burkholderia thailandensis]MCS6467912.1 hypothetical protein [Burkholderia thailandensis]MCS6477605.1 hypothetical protein [Burkholderia thailandensis]